MSCVVDGCKKPRGGKAGMCFMHASRVKRYGSTEPRRGSRGTLAERFERFVVRTDGCWDWTGGFNNKGYTIMGGVYGHRLSYELHRGAIPDGMFVLHRCDNRRCTNPDHLFIGTHADNMADARAKGRLNGSPSRGQKITIEQAREIRALCAQGVPRSEISERYGLSEDSVGRIANRKRWASA